MAQPKKQLIFVGSSKDDISGFPKEAKIHIGHTLHEIQAGTPHAELHGVKSFVSIGPGTYEVTTHSGNDGLDHRTFFVAKFEEAIYVLHAFEKRQQKTPKREIALAKTRYQDVIEGRKALKKAKTK